MYAVNQTELTRNVPIPQKVRKRYNLFSEFPFNFTFAEEKMMSCIILCFCVRCRFFFELAVTTTAKYN